MNINLIRLFPPPSFYSLVPPPYYLSIPAAAAAVEYYYWFLFFPPNSCILFFFFFFFRRMNGRVERRPKKNGARKEGIHRQKANRDPFVTLSSSSRYSLMWSIDKAPSRQNITKTYKKEQLHLPLYIIDTNTQKGQSCCKIIGLSYSLYYVNCLSSINVYK